MTIDGSKTNGAINSANTCLEGINPYLVLDVMDHIDSTIHDVKTLREVYRSGKRLKFLFFWSHKPKVQNHVGKECLSQWYPCTFEVDGVSYSSAEQFMMAEKARLFNDQETLAQILQARHPGAAKKYGRSVRGFVESVWESNRSGIVVTGNYAKFSQNESLLAFLVRTQNRILVEASPRDQIWGIGLGEEDERSDNPEEWQGLNLLGFALMEVRSMLENLD